MTMVSARIGGQLCFDPKASGLGRGILARRKAVACRHHSTAECLSLSMVEHPRRNTEVGRHRNMAECRRHKTAGSQPLNMVVYPLRKMAASQLHNMAVYLHLNMADYRHQRAGGCHLLHRTSMSVTFRLGRIS